MTYLFEPIGLLKTPFREKFGVPRQSMMTSEAKGILKLNLDPKYLDAIRHLDQFSHIWIIFVFHKNGRNGWHPLIETPRVEAGARMGLFATRSPHRPNPIGMSAVKLERIDRDARGGIEIHLSGVDLLDGTPVLDIKPYIPYADQIADANSGWIKTDIEIFPVDFSEDSLVVLASVSSSRHPALKRLIEQMLELDPRPTSQRRAAPISDPATEGLSFAFRILDFDVRWQVKRGRFHVYQIVDLQ